VGQEGCSEVLAGCVGRLLLRPQQPAQPAWDAGQFALQGLHLCCLACPLLRQSGLQVPGLGLGRLGSGLSFRQAAGVLGNRTPVGPPKK